MTFAEHLKWPNCYFEWNPYKVAILLHECNVLILFPPLVDGLWAIHEFTCNVLLTGHTSGQSITLVQTFTIDGLLDWINSTSASEMNCHNILYSCVFPRWWLTPLSFLLRPPQSFHLFLNWLELHLFHNNTSVMIIVRWNLLPHSFLYLLSYCVCVRQTINTDRKATYLQLLSSTHWFTVSWQIRVWPPHVPLCRVVVIFRQLWSEVSHSHMTSISATLCGMLPKNCWVACWQRSRSHCAMQAWRTSARYLLQTASLTQTPIWSKQDAEWSYTARRKVAREFLDYRYMKRNWSQNGHKCDSF